MVWDQHSQYFEARGEIRDPRSMFRLDLVSLLRWWKADGDEIVLMGDFNENVYSGQIAGSLAGDDLRLQEMCHRTTGRCLPPTHTRGRVPIDAVYGTAGLQCTVVALLPGRAGVGDHRVLIVDIDSETILGGVFPRVIPITGRLLNCASDKIRNNYVKVLNKLANRHLILRKMLLAEKDSDYILHSQLQLRMNSIDLKLEQV